ncbi:Piso0_003751 [Millerozyma farinosa CBS 7064]|uniref:Aminopeptidase n=1 Tax=Pichia sorbitophila (strain ATCC MYA-4447 / BCRC 22081 / CBS 7064 / NBRC 10061 / NRRL Y-12695) TaxID=559304 RepID=G8Y873_PICSO|nr:Piso0_003751 [Millerozyma farinosa CBS 7064]CCE84210.1 Piso0_003751 [Millerozyma farinosa CBS 7064]
MLLSSMLRFTSKQFPHLSRGVCASSLCRLSCSAQVTCGGSRESLSRYPCNYSFFILRSKFKNRYSQHIPKRFMTTESTDRSRIESVNSKREVLPTNIKPLHYDVTLEPNFDTFTFDGHAKIDLDVKEVSHSITLNCLELTLHKTSLNGGEIRKVDFDTERQTATFHLASALTPGDHAKLDIKFSGILNDKMAGFYRSSYIEDGKKKYLATTQFEATDCRRAFPSFDEPAWKATFDINLITQRDLVALSNMDVKSTTILDSDRKLVAFNTTPLMSTYLVAFIVGDLKYIENNDYRVPIRVYSTPGSEHLGRYSADLAAKSLKFFDEKFDIPYPLPKCDLVAIHDFSAGAMENFGLITFRTVDLLLDEQNVTLAVKKRVTEVVVHELAHQWFGNLVTMEYWDGLWLNEGFATWMSWYACDTLFPEWKVWESYVSDTLQHALSLDSLRSSHPIEVPIVREDQIDQIFDAISYSKGSSVLKMITNWVGEDAFIEGVSNYLKKHKWGNTKNTDLWLALNEVSGKNVTDVMDIWTKKVGFPLLKVEELGDNKLRLTQNRFLATNDVKKTEDETIFPIFLDLKTSKGINKQLVLNSRSETIQLPTSDDFYKVNANHSGIYRVSYETERWMKLGQDGADGKLSVEDRVGLVADAGSLASSGYIRPENYFNLVKLWKNEESYVVWEQIIGNLASIKSAFLFSDPRINEGIDAFTAELLSTVIARIGWNISPTDNESAQELKSVIFSAASNAGMENAVTYSQECFSRYISGDKQAIHPNLRSTVFGTVARFGNRETYESLLGITRNPNSEIEKLAALRSLGKIRDPELLDEFSALLMDRSLVKSQDIHIPLAGLRTHKSGIETMWGWFIREWSELLRQFPPGLPIMRYIVQISTSGFTLREQKKMVEDFFAHKDQKGFDQALAQSLDTVSMKIALSSNEATNLQRWLVKNGYK